METFKALTPEEIKLATVQFMGQHLTGEMKELNKNIIGESATLRGLTIDPMKVINSVGGSSPYATAVNAGINVQRPQPQPQPQPASIVNIQPSSPQTVNDPDQLTFDFEKTSYAKSIFDRLDAINSKLERIEKTLNTLK